MHVIRQYRPSQHGDARRFPGTGYRTSDVRRRRGIHAPDALIRVPCDMRVHLKRVVSRHFLAECLWLTDPGRKPGVSNKDRWSPPLLRYQNPADRSKKPSTGYGPVQVMSPISAEARTLRPSVSAFTPIDTIGLGALFQRRR